MHRCADEKRVAVGRRLRDLIGSRQPGGPGAVVDDQRLPQFLSHFLRHDAGQQIVRASGRIRHDHPHGLAGVVGSGLGLCRRQHRQIQQQGSAQASPSQGLGVNPLKACRQRHVSSPFMHHGSCMI